MGKQSPNINPISDSNVWSTTNHNVKAKHFGEKGSSMCYCVTQVLNRQFKAKN